MLSASERQIKVWELTAIIGSINVADDLAEDRWSGVVWTHTGRESGRMGKAKK